MRELRTGRDEALGDVEGLDALERVGAARFVVCGNLRCGSGDIELALCKRVELLKEEVEDVELHVVEGVEEGVDELRRLDKEARKLVLHCGVDEFVLVGRDFEVLFELRASGHLPTREHGKGTHLKQVLLVVESLLFLVSEFRQRVIEAIVVNQLRQQ